MVTDEWENGDKGIPWPRILQIMVKVFCRRLKRTEGTGVRWSFGRGLRQSFEVEF